MPDVMSPSPDRPKSRAGRKPRKDNPVKVTLYISAKTRRLGDKLASGANQSLSQLVQTLLEERHQEAAR